MSCNCTALPVPAPDGSALPAILEVEGLTNPPQNCGCCNDSSCLDSDPSGGSSLEARWLDSQCTTSDVTILGRVGSTLVRFAGDGFLKLVNGKASVVSAIPIQVRSLWHRWWKPSALQRPIIGEPLPFPYLVIGDSKGNLHGISGPSETNGIPYWNIDTKEFSLVTATSILERALPIPSGSGTYVLKRSAALGFYWSPANP